MSTITYIGCESGDRGEIIKFDIDGKRYEYDVGFYFMEKINNLARHSPKKALNLAKQSGRLVKLEEKNVRSSR